MQASPDAVQRFYQRQKEIIATSAARQSNFGEPALVPLVKHHSHRSTHSENGAGGVFLNLHVGETQVQAHLQEFVSRWDAQNCTAVWDECSRNVLQSVAVPFGLGHLATANDRIGGLVDTVHNARKGIYASEQEQTRYEQRGQYLASNIHSHRDYQCVNAQTSKVMHEDGLTDTYSGRRMRAEDRHHAQKKPNLDHVISAHEIHDDAGRVLAELDTATLANRTSNLRATSASINKSKKALSAQAFADKLEHTAPVRRQRIAELRKKGPNLAQQERAELTKLRELESVDSKRLRQADAQARQQHDREVNRTHYTSRKFATQTLGAAASQGLRGAGQQALGVVLVEFLSNLMTEIRDWARNGRQGHQGRSLLGELRERCLRVARSCAAKWSDALAALGKGFVGGLLASLVTTLLNTFETTTKRLMRILREGSQSLLGALRILIAPPANMEWRERVHEASKVLLTGAMLVGGLALEEWFCTYLKAIPWLAPIATWLVPAVVGAFTAIATTFAVFLVDKADLLGVMEQRRLQGVVQLLNDSIVLRERAIEHSLTRQPGGWLLGLEPPTQAASLQLLPPDV